MTLPLRPHKLSSTYPYHSLPGDRPAMTPKEVLTLVREKEIKAIDLRFVDFPGTWQHFTIPANQLEESTFEDGLGFDGSSIRGWQAINESDMLVIPQADTAFFGPELEFFVFDSVRFDQTQNAGYYFLDSSEGAWNSGKEGPDNQGY